MSERIPRPKSTRHEDLLKSQNDPNHIPKTQSLEESEKQRRLMYQRKSWTNDGTTVSEHKRVLNYDDETNELTLDTRRPSADFYEDSTESQVMENLGNVLQKTQGFERLKAEAGQRRQTKERIDSIRARLDEIERAAGNGGLKKNYDSEVDSLENELRSLEKSTPMPEGYWKREGTTESPASQAQEEKVSAIEPKTVHEQRKELSSIISQIEQYESPVLYLPDLSKKEAEPAGSVIRLPDLSADAEGNRETPITTPEVNVSPTPERTPSSFAYIDRLFNKTPEAQDKPEVREPFSYNKSLTNEQKDIMAERAGLVDERTAMQDAEAKYLTAYKNFYATNNALERLGKSTIPSHEADVLKSLEAKYKNARYAYSKKMSDSVSERLEKRESRGGEKGTGTRKELTPEQKAKIEERYQRLIHLNEIVAPAFEKRTQARAEALNAKGRNAFEKGIGFLAKTNKKFEDMVGGKRNAVAIRAFAVAAGLTLGVASTGALAASGVLGLAGFGAYKFTRSIIGAAAGTGVGILTGKEGRKRSLLRQKQSKKELDRLKTQKVFSKKSLESLDAAYEKHSIRSKDETVERDAALATALGSFIGGAGVTLSAGAFLEAYNHLDHLSHAANATHHPAHAATEHAKAPHHQATIQTEHHTAGAHEQPVVHHAEALKPGTATESATIDKHGEGMDKLFKQLRHTIDAKHIPANKMSPAMAKFMDPKLTPDQFSKNILALTGGHVGNHVAPLQSMTMHMGDKMYWDDHNNLWFEKHGSTSPELVMSSDGTMHQLHDHMSPAIHHSTTAEHSNATAHKVENAGTAAAAAEASSTTHPQAEAQTTTPTPQDSSEPSSPLTPDRHSINQSSSEAVQTQPSQAAPVESQTASPAPETQASNEFSAEIDTIHNSPIWNDYKGYSAEGAFTTVPTQPQEIALHDELFKLLKETGIGINGSTETLQDYVARINEAVSNGHTSPVSIIETADHHLIATGGDISAQHIVAQEYIASQPEDVQSKLVVLIKDPTPKTNDYFEIKATPAPAGIGDIVRINAIDGSKIKIDTDPKVIY